ncbi:MAG: hypothetical protein ACYDHH_22495 [Solirubrobacteraceae bacterium]
MLEEKNGVAFYHRGHPIASRWQEEPATIDPVRGRVVANAGLWLGEPDVDAVTRLCRPVDVTSRSTRFPDHVACALGTWAPFNSQNTALLRDVIPIYLLFPHVGRYDDIWASYVVRYVADGLGDLVTYGAPVVRQERNPHDLLKDLDAERLGMEYTDAFVAGLRDEPLVASGYADACFELAARLPASLEVAARSHGKAPSAFDDVATGFELWADIFKDIARETQAR